MASALDSLTSSDLSKTTTMPSWYDAAQQQAVNSATSNVGNMPSIGNTVAGQAINTLSGPNNPFTQAQGNLNTIATGAANPWLTDATTGAVTPNTNTAMGGLFAAQNQQLQTLLPQYEAPATAGSVASGNFGSLRGQTAADTAVTNAQANLFTNQMQEALQNQQTGVNAATGLGNVGAQGTTAMTDVGKIQQADPMAQSGALAALLKNINAPTSVGEVTTPSTLDALGALGTFYNKLPTSITGPIDSSVGSILGSIFGTGTGSTSPTSDIPESTTPTVDNSDTSNNNYGTVDTNIPDYTGAVYPDYSTTP